MCVRVCVVGTRVCVSIKAFMVGNQRWYLLLLLTSSKEGKGGSFPMEVD